jgi:signal transduction histidine kinase
MIGYRSAFEARSPLQLWFRFRRTDDSYAFVTAEGVPKFLADGNLAGYVCALREIKTEDSDNGSTDGRRRRNRALGSPEKLLQHLDASADPVVVLNHRGRAVYCNEALRALAAKAAPGGAPDGAARVDPRAKGRVLARASDCIGVVQAWLSSVSDFRNIRISANPISLGGERMIAFSILDTIEASEGRSLGRAFLHDLLNAVGGIQMLIDLLLEGTSRKERIEYIRLLQLSMNRLLSQIDARMMRHDTETKQTVCNVHEVLEEVLNRHRRLPLAISPRIRYAENVSESAMVLCDGRFLVELLDNMMRNVIEDTNEGVVVELECRRIDTEFEFSFKRALSPKRIRTSVRAQGFNLVPEQWKDNAMVSSEAILSIRYPAAKAADIASSRAASHNKTHAS